MKNKIFNAIQKGLANALVFDDTDSTISYQKSDVNNNVTVPAVTLDELYKIFKENPENIFCYDTKESLSLILDDGYEMSLHYYTVSDKPVFLKISNETLKNSGNEIIIACNNNHYISTNNLWQIRTSQVLADDYLLDNKYQYDLTADFDGYKKFQLLTRKSKNIKNSNNMPAIKYCAKIEGPLNYEAYMPSIGQLYFILKYLDMINYIFKQCGCMSLNLYSDEWWSSSERKYNYAWGLNNGKINDMPKYDPCNVLPLFIQK